MYHHTTTKKKEKKKKITYYAVKIGEDNNNFRKKIYMKITSNFDDMLFFLHQRGCTFYFERISGKVKGHMYFTCPESEEHRNPRQPQLL